MHQKTLLLLTIFIGLFASITLSCKESQSTSALLQKVGAEPSNITTADITLPTVTGSSQISLSDYKGSLVVLSIWIASCRYCNLEAPLLAELGKLAQKNENIQLLGISRDSSKETAEAFINTYGLKSYPHLFDPGGDSHKNAGFNIKGTPATFIISPKGKVLGEISGYKDFNPEETYKTLKNIYENTK